MFLGGIEVEHGLIDGLIEESCFTELLFCEYFPFNEPHFLEEAGGFSGIHSK